MQDFGCRQILFSRRNVESRRSAMLKRSRSDLAGVKKVEFYAGNPQLALVL